MNHRLCARETVQVRICSKLLMWRYVSAGPVEEKGKGHVDYADKEGRVED